MSWQDPSTDIENVNAAYRLLQADHAKWIRAFNRLEKAVTNHTRDCIDCDGLEHAHRAVMKDLTTPTKAHERASEASNDR